MNIVTKFTVATEQGIEDLFQLKKAKFKNMYENIVQMDQLNIYIDQQLNDAHTVQELNTLGNQMITLYVDNKTAGFALIKQGGICPKMLQGKRILHYSFFYILPQYDNPATRTSLWQKCFSLSKIQDATWIEMLRNDPLVPFLESCGFVIHEKSAMKPFDQPSYILIWYNAHNEPMATIS